MGAAMSNPMIDHLILRMERDARVAVENGHAGIFKNAGATGTALWNVVQKPVRSLWDNKEKRYNTITNVAVGAAATVVGIGIIAGTAGIGTPAAIAISGGIYVGGKAAAYGARKGVKAIRAPRSRDWLANYKLPTNFGGLDKTTNQETWDLTTEAQRSARRIGLRFNLALKELSSLKKIVARLEAKQSGPAFKSVDDMRDAFRTSARFVHESSKAQNNLLVCIDAVFHQIGTQGATAIGWSRQRPIIMGAVEALLMGPADVCQKCKVCYHHKAEGKPIRGSATAGTLPMGLTVGKSTAESACTNLISLILGCDEGIRAALTEARNRPRTSKELMDNLKNGKAGTEEVWLDEHIIKPVFDNLENPKGLSSIGHNIRNQWMKSTTGEKVGRGVAEAFSFAAALSGPAVSAGNMAAFGDQILTNALGGICTRDVVGAGVSAGRSLTDILVGVLANAIPTGVAVSGGGTAAQELKLDKNNSDALALSEGKIKRLFIKSEELFEKAALHNQLAYNALKDVASKFEGKSLDNCDKAFEMLVRLHEFMHHYDKVTKYTCENLVILANFVQPIIEFSLLEATCWNVVHTHGAAYFYNTIHGQAK